MKKFKYLFVLPAISLMALTSCGDNGKNPYEALPEETSAEIIEELKINEVLNNYADANSGKAIYGNIRLVDKLSDGSKVKWWSSNKIIKTKAYGDADPGVVKRPKKDTEVTLVAEIDKNGEKTKYEQTVTVKAAAPKIYDEDYEGYLFAHFVGEGHGEGPQSMEGHPIGEQIYFALADVGQGLHFKDMNNSTMSNLNPVLESNVGELGVRDPFMLRSPEGDTFYLIATDLSIYTRGGWGANNGNYATRTGSHSITIWESHDLVNWSEPRLIEVARKDAGMAWAPEMIYREETGEYLIFFSSTLVDDVSKGGNAKCVWKDCVYYTATRDFIHFSETKRFIPGTDYQPDVTTRNESEGTPDNINQRKVIDGSVMKIGDYYYCACKDGGNNEDGGGIRIMKTESLIPEEDEKGEEYIPWEFVQNLADVGFQAQGRKADNKCLEGPEWFIYNQADREDEDVEEIGLMADFYANTSVGYIPWSTTDVEDINNENGSWKILESGEDKDFSWDNQTKRHGTIVRITAAEAKAINDAFGKKK